MIADARFAPVRDAFEASLRDGRERGARFCVVIDGEPVIDLWGGYADKAGVRPFDETTLTPVFSVTKLLAAVLIARLVDQGRIAYDDPVSSVWPAFAAAGKERTTLEQVLSHQAGLSGFLDPMEPEDWFDWEGVCDRLAAMAPLWPAGGGSGYHPVTFGYLAGEVFRRVDGRTMGRALREDLADPLGLDLFIGVPASEDARIAELERPHALPKFGRMTPALRAAFLTRWAAPGGRGSTAWRRSEIPSVTGHATAMALARLTGLLATDGGGILAPSAVRDLSRQRCFGEDRVLPFTLSWGAGVMRNQGLGIYGPGQETFGHSGWGGACAFADPERRLGGAYVMNRQSADLIGDPRSRRLIDVLYACL